MTAIELMNHADRLIASGNHKTVRSYMVNQYSVGIDFNDPLFRDLLESLESILVCDVVNHPNGYTIYEWNYKWDKEA